jgi:integrase/recombinase XerD
MSAAAKSTKPKYSGLGPRSLPVAEWPEADRQAWSDACKPGSRLRSGGAAAYLAEVSRDDFARRYGAFLGFLQRKGELDPCAASAALVTPTNVERYLAALTSRVSSVTVWNCIYKLRRAAELIAPTIDFNWLAEIEKDAAVVAVPRSKYDRLVLMERLFEAGLDHLVGAGEQG